MQVSTVPLAVKVPPLDESCLRCPTKITLPSGRQPVDPSKPIGKALVLPCGHLVHVQCLHAMQADPFFNDQCTSCQRQFNRAWVPPQPLSNAFLLGCYNAPRLLGRVGNKFCSKMGYLIGLTTTVGFFLLFGEHTLRLMLISSQIVGGPNAVFGMQIGVTCGLAAQVFATMAVLYEGKRGREVVIKAMFRGLPIGGTAALTVSCLRSPSPLMTCIFSLVGNIMTTIAPFFLRLVHDRSTRTTSRLGGHVGRVAGHCLGFCAPARQIVGGLIMARAAVINRRQQKKDII